MGKERATKNASVVGATIVTISVALSFISNSGPYQNPGPYLVVSFLLFLSIIGVSVNILMGASTLRDFLVVGIVLAYLCGVILMAYGPMSEFFVGDRGYPSIDVVAGTMKYDKYSYRVIKNAIMDFISIVAACKWAPSTRRTVLFMASPELWALLGSKLLIVHCRIKMVTKNARMENHHHHRPHRHPVAE